MALSINKSHIVTVMDPLYVQVLISTRTYLSLFVGLAFILSLVGNGLVI